MYMLEWVCTHMHTWIHAHTCAYSSISIHTYTHVHTQVSVCTHMSILWKNNTFMMNFDSFICVQDAFERLGRWWKVIDGLFYFTVTKCIINLDFLCISHLSLLCQVILCFVFLKHYGDLEFQLSFLIWSNIFISVGRNFCLMRKNWIVLLLDFHVV